MSSAEAPQASPRRQCQQSNTAATPSSPMSPKTAAWASGDNQQSTATCATASSTTPPTPPGPVEHPLQGVAIAEMQASRATAAAFPAPNPASDAASPMASGAMRSALRVQDVQDAAAEVGAAHEPRARDVAGAPACFHAPRRFCLGAPAIRRPERASGR